MYYLLKKKDKKEGAEMSKDFFKRDWLSIVALLLALTALVVRLLK